MLNVAELLLPDTRQLGTFQEFFMDEVYQFHACRCGNETFALRADVVALEERLDDSSTGGGATDAVLLHDSTQFLVLDQLTGGLHGTEEGGLGVVGRRRGPFLGEGGLVRTALAFHEGGKGALFFVRVLGGGWVLGVLWV